MHDNQSSQRLPCRSSWTKTKRSTSYRKSRLRNKRTEGRDQGNNLGHSRQLTTFPSHSHSNQNLPTTTTTPSRKPPYPMTPTKLDLDFFPLLGIIHTPDYITASIGFKAELGLVTYVPRSDLAITTEHSWRPISRHLGGIKNEH